VTALLPLRYMNRLWILPVRYLGGVLIEGGSDTTSFFIQSLVLALVSFPEVARKAQEEIDHIVGPHRLPTMNDFEHLPYIGAIVQEALFCPLSFMLRTDAIMFCQTHRWRPAAPLLIPHASISDEKACLCLSDECNLY
jgi:hypothetical protein